MPRLAIYHDTANGNDTALALDHATREGVVSLTSSDSGGYCWSGIPVAYTDGLKRLTLAAARRRFPNFADYLDRMARLAREAAETAR